MATRDEIRRATLGSPAVVESATVEWNGVQLEVRRPTLRLQREIERASTLKDGSRDALAQVAHALIQCVYVPGTGEHVFDRADVDGLLDRSEKDFVGVLMRALGELASKATPEEAEKN